jgi:hypothetical protein
MPLKFLWIRWSSSSFLLVGRLSGIRDIASRAQTKSFREEKRKRLSLKQNGYGQVKSLFGTAKKNHFRLILSSSVDSMFRCDSVDSLNFALPESLSADTHSIVENLPPQKTIPHGITFGPRSMISPNSEKRRLDSLVEHVRLCVFSTLSLYWFLFFVFF